jgi:prepilin peptidase CpaA
MTGLEDAPLVAGVAAALFGFGWAAMSDVTRYEIPNRAGGLAAAGWLLAALVGTPGQALAGLATCAAVFAVCLVLYWRGWLGGADVKLAAVAALWAGPAHFADFALATGVVGAGLGLVLLSPLKRALPAPPADLVESFGHPMPYGAPIAAGGALAVLLHLAPRAIGA